jgi:hypothetical protein
MHLPTSLSKLRSIVPCVFVFAASCAGREAKPSPSEPTPPASAQLEEKALSVQLGLTGTSLKISVRDNGAPVRTDLWLYTLENGQLKAFSAFKDPDSKRKSRRLMLPATIGGQPSHLAPADNGDENGFMSDGAREKRQNGQTSSAIDGDVVVALDAVPTSPLVVVAGIEDQRYAGAAGIDANGAAVAVPAGVGVPAKHTARSFVTDIKPLFEQCVDCHAANAEVEDIKLVTYDEVVNFDLAFAEGQAQCAKKHAGDEAARTACVNAITEVEYLVEPGAPALSPIARRTRPDEERNASAEGLKWFGKGGKRYGGHGDRRMPPENTTEVTSDDRNEPIYFDTHPQQYQILFDWIAQGAPR